jgi:hypothetical protein
VIKQSGDGKLFVFSLKYIKAGGEILMKYGDEYWKADEQAALNKWIDY